MTPVTGVLPHRPGNCHPGHGFRQAQTCPLLSEHRDTQKLPSSPSAPGWLGKWEVASQAPTQARSQPQAFEQEAKRACVPEVPGWGTDGHPKDLKLVSTWRDPSPTRSEPVPTAVGDSQGVEVGADHSEWNDSHTQRYLTDVWRSRIQFFCN